MIEIRELVIRTEISSKPVQSSSEEEIENLRRQLMQEIRKILKDKRKKNHR